MKIFHSIIIVTVLSTSMFGCDKVKSVTGGDVSLVKGGTLEIDKSLTVGQAIDNYKYFKKTKWESLKTDNGRRIVQVKSDIDTAKSPTMNPEKLPQLKSAQIQFQFKINTDNTFEVAWCGIALEKTDGTKVDPDQNVQIQRCLTTLKGIYNNDPDI